MKQGKQLVSLLLVSMLVFSMFSCVFAAQEIHLKSTQSTANQPRQGITFDFDDLDEAAWAEEYIGKMQSKEVIKGYGNGKFKPNAPVTRLEAVVMAVRLMGLEKEALAKSSNIALHFKDANKIPQWGRGHVAVALENGLFNATEEKIQSDKPASRVWIVQLLVKALDLEKEALRQMNNIPDFKDIDDIPAGSIGYVNVAVEQGITTGYGDNTFRPNQPVKRGEMAAFLERTNEGLLENSGALTVQGIITAIEFDDEVGTSTVTNEVYKPMDGTITIQTFGGEQQTYAISSDLLVQYHNRFIQAHQLIVNDIVTLVVQNGRVIEANLVDEEEVNTDSNLVEFKIELKIGKERQLDIMYKNKKGKVLAEIKTETEDEIVKITGKEAISEVEEFIAQLSLTPEMSEAEILDEVLSVLEINESEFEELEIEIKFSNGKKVEIEMEDEDEDEDEDKDEEQLENEGYNGIVEFILQVELVEENKLKLSYENEDGKIKAQVEKQTQKGKEKYKGEQAVQAIESLLDEIALTEDMNEEDIKELEIEIKFTNDKEIDIQFENDASDEEDEEDD